MWVLYYILFRNKIIIFFVYPSIFEDKLILETIVTLWIVASNWINIHAIYFQIFTNSLLPHIRISSISGLNSTDGTLCTVAGVGQTKRCVRRARLYQCTTKRGKSVDAANRGTLESRAHQQASACSAVLGAPRSQPLEYNARGVPEHF